MFNQLRKAAQDAKNKLVDSIDESQQLGQFQCPICLRRFNNPEVLIQEREQEIFKFNFKFSKKIKKNSSSPSQSASRNP